MSASASHANAATTQLLGLSAQQRIRAIRSERWVSYPRVQKTIQILEQILDHPRKTRMPSIAIIGDSGMGAAWGDVFWSMQITRFEDVHLPHLTVAEPNPSALLDFRRFSSRQVRAYDAQQIEIVRRHSPGRWITRNFMGFFNEFDHWDLGETLDFASWDSYPIGFVEPFPFSEAEQSRWQATSHPDIAPFHHDLYRGVRHGKF